MNEDIGFCRVCGAYWRCGCTPARIPPLLQPLPLSWNVQAEQQQRLRLAGLEEARKLGLT
jgi:hypothetical protein